MNEQFVSRGRCPVCGKIIGTYKGAISDHKREDKFLCEGSGQASMFKAFLREIAAGGPMTELGREEWQYKDGAPMTKEAQDFLKYVRGLEQVVGGIGKVLDAS